ncbi:MAG: hypothetical protein RLP09_44870 [Sandaracinaceae bacterium]
MQMERTRLYVDGVRAPLKADVTRRRQDGLVVSQSLPFLRLDTPVTEDGRRARISRVAIAMDGDVPRLLLELSHDEDATSTAMNPPTGDDTSDDTIAEFTPGVSMRPARTDGTVPYEFQTETPGTREVVLSDPPPALPAPRPTLAARLWRTFLGLALLLVGRPQAS